MRKIAFVALTLAGALALVAGINFVRLGLPVRAALEHEEEVSFSAYYRYGVVPDSVVFDLRRVELTAGHVDVLRVFFNFAEEMKNRRFREVRLAWRGETRFVLPGEDFRTIGQERAWQNPLHTMQIMPEMLLDPDGNPAFGHWTGGWLGVMSRRLEDVNAAAYRWYRDNLIAAY